MTETVPKLAKMDDEQRPGPPPLPQHNGKPLEPVASAERVASLDVLRGLALLGILIANMMHFAQPLEVSGLRSGLWFGTMDRIADWISVLLVDGKFYPLFSILFGLGFSLQMDRAAARGIDHGAVHRRRLFILMGIGLAHAVLVWDGDVLFPYAVCGFALPLFRNTKPRTTLVWSAGLIVLPALLFLFLGLVLAAFWDSAALSEIEDAGERQELMRAFVTGGYADAVSHRLRELVFSTFTTMSYTPVFLGLFLIGMLAGRKGIITKVGEHRGALARILVVCGAVGLAGNFFGAWAMIGGSARENIGLLLIGTAIISLFGPVLTAAYIAGIVLLIDRWPASTFLPPVAAVGRMALTNYLGQSLVATTLFYGYGFGLGHNVGRLGTVGIALLIFAAQVAFSVVWLRFFRHGPMEWLWRSLTYGKRQPMKRERPSPLAGDTLRG